MLTFFKVASIFFGFQVARPPPDERGNAMNIKDNPEIPEQLKNILYISLPEGTGRKIDDFIIDENHLIPVEIPKGESELDLTNLSWEMIVSAMLRIFAYKPDHSDIEYYRKFIHAVQPDIIPELTKTGVIKAENKDFLLAEEIFLALNHFAPEEPFTFLNLAFLYEEMAEIARKTGSKLKENYLSKAFETYTAGLEVHPDHPDMHFYSGYFYLKNQNPSKTREHFEFFLGLAPEDERSSEIREITERISMQSQDDQLFTEAFDLIMLENEPEAITRIDQFLQRNPHVWNAWFLKGWAHRRLGEYSKGKYALEKSLELEKYTTDIFNELAICCMETGFLTQAYNHLKEALAIEPENTKIISNFGVLELKKGNPDEALRFFLIVQELDPDDAIAADYISKLSEA
ncbi:MAG: tetratricopeptide repeat protein [Spirochaetia bacterium]|nr:tetratricopeptide repeat protein [Spirochaetia bacterium]